MGSPWSSGKRTRSATKGSAVQIPPILTSFGLGFWEFEGQLEISRYNCGNCNNDEESGSASVMKEKERRKMTRLEPRPSGWIVNCHG